MKTCRMCKESKPPEEFHRASNSPDGRQYRCKTCAVAAARQWQLDHPEAAREADRRYRQTDKYRENRARRRVANREKIAEQKRASYYRNHEAALERNYRMQRDPEFRAKQRERWYRWRESDPRGVHRNALKNLYHLTLEQYDAMVLAQEGRCRICSDEMVQAVIDHDHSCCPDYRCCGKCVRGLLCSNCNAGLGQFKDDPVRLAAAISYLQAHVPA